MTRDEAIRICKALEPAHRLDFSEVEAIRLMALGEERKDVLDRFAGMAMQGLLSGANDAISQDMAGNCRADPRLAANSAYEFAEAMLVARSCVM